MKPKKIMYGLFFALVMVLIFSACPNGTTDNNETQEEEEEQELETDGKTIILRNIKVSGDPLFFSLSTGKQVTDPTSKEWDVAFPGGRQIWTNSGDSAAESGGQGGVWYTNKTDFKAVTGKDDIVNIADDPNFSGFTNFDYSLFNQDTYRYVVAMDANASFQLYYRRLNIMSYIGYGNEDETGAGLSESKPYDVQYKYNKKAFYRNAGSMPPNFQPTKQVYIIRHGDGIHYSKFQVTAYTRNPDTFTIKFENLPEEE
jgi:hypothetical protein